MAKILIIDDDPIAQTVIHEIAAECGFTQFTLATDGADAARNYIDAPNEYSLIICDLMMPEFDGVEFMDFLSSFQNPPPLIICSSAGSVHINSAIAEADKLNLNLLGHLGKPFNIAELRTLVKNIPNGAWEYQAALRSAG